MASRGLEMGIVLVLVAMLWVGARAQSSCISAFTSLAPCLNFVTGNSSTPSSSCCSQLGNVAQSSPQCLCSVLNGNVPPIGININQTLALSLPGACKVQTPPISQCKAANGPATSPASTPVSSPALSPASSPTDSSSNETPEPDITPSAPVVPSGNGGSSGTGSKTVPTTAGTSDGSIIKAPFNFVLFLLFIASCTSTITNF